MKPLQKLLAFAHAHRLYVTCTTEGHHNVGSLHYLGRAMDVRSHGLTDAQVHALAVAAAAEGMRLLDERARPPRQKVWGGPHLHIEVPLPR